MKVPLLPGHGAHHKICAPNRDKLAAAALALAMAAVPLALALGGMPTRPLRGPREVSARALAAADLAFAQAAAPLAFAYGGMPVRSGGHAEDSLLRLIA